MRIISILFCFLIFINEVESKCNAGYYLSSGSCKKCAAGRFQPYPGQASCNICPAGQYSTGRATYCTGIWNCAPTLWAPKAELSTQMFYITPYPSNK